MCGCNMINDGIDMDVLRSLPSKMIKKIAYHSNLPMGDYNDALKQAIKAKARVGQTNVRGFLTGIPGVEAEIIKIEKMKEGGNLYAPYPKKAQGPFGPKYVDSKTMLSTYAEGQEKKRKEQYRTDMLKSMMQQGGSILNDIGKEHLIIPRNQGTELNIPKYIQAYVQATTNMGKYEDGGSFKEKFKKFGGMEAVAGIAGQVADMTKPPAKEVDPNEPPLTRFSKGGVSETMNFYIQNYPGYREGIKDKFQDGGKVVIDGVVLTKEQITTYNDLLKKNNGKIKTKKGYRSGESKPSLLHFHNSNGDWLGSISYTPEQEQTKTGKINSVSMPKKDSEESTEQTRMAKLKARKDWLLDPNNAIEITGLAGLEMDINDRKFQRVDEQKEWDKQKPFSGYKGTDIVVGVKLDPDQLYKIEDFLGGRKGKETIKDVLARGEFMRKGADVIQVSNDGKTLDITYTPKQDIEGAKWLNENKSNKVTGKTPTQPVKKLKPVKPVDVSNFETVTKGGIDYKVDPNTRKVYTSKGEVITDRRFNDSVLTDYKAPIKTIDLKTQNFNLQEESKENSENKIVPTGVYNQNLIETKVKQSLNSQTPIVIEDTRTKTGKFIDATGEKVKDFFTRSEEEKEERKKLRKLKKNDEVKSSTNNSKKESELTSVELVEIIAFTKDPAERDRLGALFNAAVERERKQRGEPAQKEGEIIFNNTSKNKRGNKLLKRI